MTQGRLHIRRHWVPIRCTVNGIGVVVGPGVHMTLHTFAS